MFEKNKIGFGAIAVLLGLSSAAAAQSFEQDWEGFYGGIHVDATVYENTISDLNNQFNRQSPQLSILTGQGGVTVGYNYQLESNFIISAELDYASEIVVDEFFSSNDTETTGQQYDLAVEGVTSLRGRAGFVQGNALSYITVGVAQATTNFESYQIDTARGVVDCDSSVCARTTEDLLGISVGFGMEWAFRENWAARAEVQHYAFESVQAPVTDADGEAPCDTGATDICTVGYSPETTTIRFGVSYYF